jgi:hypothetical protein
LQLAVATLVLIVHGEVCVSVTPVCARLTAWKRPERLKS